MTLFIDDYFMNSPIDWAFNREKKPPKKPAKSEAAVQPNLSKPHHRLAAEEVTNKVAAVNLWKT